MSFIVVSRNNTLLQNYDSIACIITQTMVYKFDWLIVLLLLTVHDWSDHVSSQDPFMIEACLTEFVTQLARACCTADSGCFLPQWLQPLLYADIGHLSLCVVIMQPRFIWDQCIRPVSLQQNGVRISHVYLPTKTYHIIAAFVHTWWFTLADILLLEKIFCWFASGTGIEVLIVNLQCVSVW